MKCFSKINGKYLFIYSFLFIFPLVGCISSSLKSEGLVPIYAVDNRDKGGKISVSLKENDPNILVETNDISHQRVYYVSKTMSEMILKDTSLLEKIIDSNK